MPSRALPDLIARVRLDSTGLDSGLQNMVGSFGKASLALAGLAAGIGLLVVGAKSMVDIAEKQDTAMRGLEQAYATRRGNHAGDIANVEAFIDTNKRYVTNQFDVLTGMASIIRAGHGQKDAFRILNEALDWSVIKHEDLSIAAATLIKVFAGNQKALRELGITTVEYNAIMKSHHTTLWKHHALMTLIEHKTKDGRKAQSDLKQSQNELNHSWEHLSKTGGPVIVTLLQTIVDGAQHAYDWFDKIGKDDHLWATISANLVLMGGWIHEYIIKPLQLGTDLLQIFGGAGAGGGNADAGKGGKFGTGIPSNQPKGGHHRAGGGPVVPGGIYTIGEQGPETLVMGSRGGMVIPNSGRGGMTVVVNVGGSVVTERNLVMAVREGIRQADRSVR